MISHSWLYELFYLDLLQCQSRKFVVQKQKYQRIVQARIVQIDFCGAFDRVNHQGILNNLSYVGI